MSKIEIEDLIERFNQGASGEIIKTQTTYLDIKCCFQSEISPAQKKFRIQYIGKREFSLSESKFTQLQLFQEHPLLLNFIEPIVTIHLASFVSDKEKFRKRLEALAHHFFGQWRSFEDYLNMPLDNFLEKSYGILMSAPKNFAEAVVQMAERDSIKLIIHDYDKKTISPFLILFDDNYVIADDFKIESLD